MHLSRFFPLTVLMATGLPVAAKPAAAQESSFDFSYGRWWTGPTVASLYTGSWHQRVLGPAWIGLGLVYARDDQTVADLSSTGGEFALNLGNPSRGPYAVGAAGLGVQHRTGSVDANWSAGAGYTLELFSVLKLAAEARYRVEDRNVHGFWRLDPIDRRGLMLQATLGFSFGSRGAPTATPVPPPTSPNPTSSGPIEPLPLSTVNELARTGGGGGSDDMAALTAAIVETAVDEMGTPYAWGGTDSNGFDCSGLIQYAYGQHGIILPRVSRDQARTGSRVDTKWTALRPGDILGFAVEGSRVTHVGLYVGEGRFIHSATGGVKLSSLTSAEPESQWWQRRWVSARRIVE